MTDPSVYHVLHKGQRPVMAVRGEIGGWYCATCGRGYCTDSEVRNGVTSFACDACNQYNAIPAAAVLDAAEMKESGVGRREQMG